MLALRCEMDVPGFEAGDGVPPLCGSEFAEPLCCKAALRCSSCAGSLAIAVRRAAPILMRNCVGGGVFAAGAAFQCSANQTAAGIRRTILALCDPGRVPRSLHNGRLLKPPVRSRGQDPAARWVRLFACVVRIHFGVEAVATALWRFFRRGHIVGSAGTWIASCQSRARAYSRYLRTSVPRAAIIIIRMSMAMVVPQSFMSACEAFSSCSWEPP